MIDKYKSRIKVCKPYGDVNKPGLTNNVIEIAYWCVKNISSKPIIRAIVKSIFDAKKDHNTYKKKSGRNFNN